MTGIWISKHTLLSLFFWITSQAFYFLNYASFLRSYRIFLQHRGCKRLNVALFILTCALWWEDPFRMTGPSRWSGMGSVLEMKTPDPCGIYTLPTSAQVNKLGGRLVALFPATSEGDGGLYLSVSDDGYHWERPVHVHLHRVWVEFGVARLQIHIPAR